MTDKLKIEKFIAFCVELFKSRHGVDGFSAAQLMFANGIFQFLRTNYDVEHCLDAEMIGDDVDTILRRKGVLV